MIFLGASVISLLRTIEIINQTFFLFDFFKLFICVTATSLICLFSSIDLVNLVRNYFKRNEIVPN